ncbi:helix-turn-helix domain-containing protein [Catenibacterium sp.]|uniref:helix-turn-helix domain-containing protein n=1 Tax=Catenibacterium sp. TaxID=2049022 RepID=UPI002E77560B|nr:helix-turn-helix transcriptional regulator [Catenibacterium sp.]MEE0821782.1 helix-turn-helix transcriptional regulator [Catenibacterium sp.]
MVLNLHFYIDFCRQAVSKWENGSSDPSTTNLIALANLFDITPEEMLKEIR